jgi:hypothetical protein
VQRFINLLIVQVSMVAASQILDEIALPLPDDLRVITAHAARVSDRYLAVRVPADGEFVDFHRVSSPDIGAVFCDQVCHEVSQELDEAKIKDRTISGAPLLARNATDPPNTQLTSFRF